ncbi:MAG: glucose 1-dehydrogenase [Bryobacterales bacterium]|jgi:glucose 1-dehydrogenase|nr:glucose 1-dehydrogenase [Bryobacterales bacterium]
MKLAGKVAIITGAGRGIGAGIARAFAREGASLVVNYNGSKDHAEALVAEIVSQGAKAIACRANVGRLAEHDGLIAAATNAFGRIDILVNNAAIDRRAPFLEATPEQWEQVVDVDLKGPYFLAQCVARVMVAANQGGAILNISSVHDEQAHRNNSLYTIAKGGMKLMTRCLALELASHRIRVNSLSPGAILTDMNRAVLSDEAYREKVLSMIPLGRIGNVEDLASAAVLLVSDDGAYITGSTFYIDGGLLL